MGTNYYAVKKKPRIVKVYDEFHLGKASVGWQFLFQEQDNIHSFEDVKKILESGEWNIKDEYGNEILLEEFYELIEYHKKDLADGNNINGYSFINSDFS